MHEALFSKEIISVLNHKLKRLDGNFKIAYVNVRLSPLSHVRPESLNAAFLQMLKMNNLENIPLNIKPSEVKLECKTCGKRFKVFKPTFACLYCKSKDLNIEEDREFLVESVEIVQ